MNIQEVMANSHRILHELNNNTLDVLARAEPGAQRSLRGMTGSPFKHPSLRMKKTWYTLPTFFMTWRQ